MSQNTGLIKIRKGTDASVNPSRRTFIKTAALTGVAALVTGVPLASYVISPSLNKGTGKWIDFGPLEDLEPSSNIFTVTNEGPDEW